MHRKAKLGGLPHTFRVLLRALEKSIEFRQLAPLAYGRM